MTDRTSQNAERTFATLQKAGENAEASSLYVQAAEFYEAAAIIHGKIAGADQAKADRLMHKAGQLRDIYASGKA